MEDLRAFVEQIMAEDHGYDMQTREAKITADFWLDQLQHDLYLTVSNALVKAQPQGNLWMVGGLGDELEPCREDYKFLGLPGEYWDLPGGYSRIYDANRQLYSGDFVFGGCNWWTAVNHPYTLTIARMHDRYPMSNVAAPGAAVYFEPYEQGASSDGHYAQCVAVAPDGYWCLVSETNAWGQGGGWGKISYRYAHTSLRTHFIYDGAHEAAGKAAWEKTKAKFRKHKRDFREWQESKKGPFYRRVIGEVKFFMSIEL